VWTSDPNIEKDGVQDTGKRDMYLGVYGAFGAGQSESYFVLNVFLCVCHN
jgi:hypothetical protein